MNELQFLECYGQNIQAFSRFLLCHRSHSATVMSILFNLHCGIGHSDFSV